MLLSLHVCSHFIKNMYSRKEIKRLAVRLEVFHLGSTDHIRRPKKSLTNLATQFSPNVTHYVFLNKKIVCFLLQNTPYLM